MSYTPLERLAFEHYTSAATAANYADISPGTCNGPHVAATGMLFAEADLHTNYYRDSLHRGHESSRRDK